MSRPFSCPFRCPRCELTLDVHGGELAAAMVERCSFCRARWANMARPGNRGPYEPSERYPAGTLHHEDRAA